MSESTTRTRLGIFLVVSHMGVVALIITFYFIGGFRFDEMTTAVALIVPMFASFTTVIVNHVISQQSQPMVSPQTVSGAFVFLSFFFPILFVTYLVTIIVLRAFNYAIQSFEQFKGLLAIGETVFAVYIGGFIGRLFKGGANP